jgi:hypothetical protein
MPSIVQFQVRLLFEKISLITLNLSPLLQSIVRIKFKKCQFSVSIFLISLLVRILSVEIPKMPLIFFFKKKKKIQGFRRGQDLTNLKSYSCQNL